MRAARFPVALKLIAMANSAFEAIIDEVLQDLEALERARAAAPARAPAAGAAPAADAAPAAPRSEGWRVYGDAERCGYTRRALDLLRGAGHAVEEVPVEKAAGWREALAVPGVPAEHRTMPIVFRGDEYVGGYDQLRARLWREDTSSTSAK